MPQAGRGGALQQQRSGQQGRGVAQCRRRQGQQLLTRRYLRVRASGAAPRPAREEAAPPRSVAARFKPDASALQLCQGGDCIPEDPAGAVLVRDDLDVLLKVLPEDIRAPLTGHPARPHLLEVVLDLGKRPEARFIGRGAEYLRDAEVTREDLDAAVALVGEFGADNRAGIQGTLHRISCIRNRKGLVVGLTCRVGRAVTGHTDMIRDLVESGDSVLILGRPGVGKTTVIRELARVLADDMGKRVVIVDSSNEIGGDGDVPHPAIGWARRMQVPDADKQHLVMIEAVENHMPEVVIVDEIGTEAEALACRTIAERGVLLIGTAHGRVLENLIKNPTLCDLVGGIQSVTLGDEEAAKRGTQKTILERKAPPTFPIVVEIRDRSMYVAHWVEDSVDALLQGRQPQVQVRERDALGGVSVRDTRYDLTLQDDGALPSHAAAGGTMSGGGGRSSGSASGGKGRLGRGLYDDDYDAALRRSREIAAGGGSGDASSDYGDVHEGLELLRMVSARRASVLSGAKLAGASRQPKGTPGITGGGAGGGRSGAGKAGRSKGR